VSYGRKWVLGVERSEREEVERMNMVLEVVKTGWNGRSDKSCVVQCRSVWHARR
jgi:hypothetical protein